MDSFNLYFWFKLVSSQALTKTTVSLWGGQFYWFLKWIQSQFGSCSLSHSHSLLPQNASCCFPFSFKHVANGNVLLGIRQNVQPLRRVCCHKDTVLISGLKLLRRTISKCSAREGFLNLMCHVGRAQAWSFNAGNFTQSYWVAKK